MESSSENTLTYSSENTKSTSEITSESSKQELLHEPKIRNKFLNSSLFFIKISM
ncbi:expressed protein [Dictyostelium purpureum]|uniref:Expressed protein n=1 Tax=Dictyostelium purpureum TaxID=5786 RepID=F0ZU08_DICPU|nr:uncharacterized protein DICPUDRAFT_89152 [Dictyostelium purpureum]EGC32561.1 expressed protein [Dictyostelium purpureum]|eukprot:XP_003290898.1 expressed protein [Dictyostelium purpureum]